MDSSIFESGVILGVSTMVLVFLDLYLRQSCLKYTPISIWSAMLLFTMAPVLSSILSVARRI